MMKTNRFGLVEEFKAYTLTLDPESSSMPSQLARQQRRSSPPRKCGNTTSGGEVNSGPLKSFFFINYRGFPSSKSLFRTSFTLWLLVKVESENYVEQKISLRLKNFI